MAQSDHRSRGCKQKSYNKRRKKRAEPRRDKRGVSIPQGRSRGAD